MGFFIRWACAFVLLAATFNPTSYNYVTWVMRYGHMNLSIAVLLGLLLLIGYVVYLRAASLWVLYDLGVLRLDNGSFNLWLGLVALSFVLGIGLSWSIFRRAVSGQADVDDVET